jgi:hypothetical protein
MLSCYELTPSGATKCPQNVLFALVGALGTAFPKSLTIGCDRRKVLTIRRILPIIRRYASDSSLSLGLLVTIAMPGTLHL